MSATDPQPIGMFDSGFGGLTVARAVIDLLPNEDLVYIGDESQLRLSLAQRDLTLTADNAPGASAPWRIAVVPARRAGGRAPSQ